MRKHFSPLIVCVFLILSFNSCVGLSEEQRREYGVLESAVAFSADKVIGEYGVNIPEDFLGDKFMELIKDKIPEDYYKALQKYAVTIRPRATYYLLLASDRGDNAIILFDYSCTPKVDGPVLLDPVKYDINKIDAFDTCSMP